MRNRRTAAMELFGLLKTMAKLMENAGDKHYSNTLNYVCDEFAYKTISSEKEQLKNAYRDCHDLGHIYGLDAEKYYKETYGHANDKRN